MARCTSTWARVRETVTSYPNFAGQHAEEAIFSPADFAAYQQRIGALRDYQPPAGVVLCYQRSLYLHVLRAGRAAGGASQRLRSTITGAWSLGPLPLRASRSTQAPDTEPARAALA